MFWKRLSFFILGFIMAFFFDFNSEIFSKSSSFIIDWDVLDGGGEKLSSDQFLILNSLGQPPIGESEGGEFLMANGYWYLFHSFIAGDIDGSLKVDVADVVYIANYLLKSGPAPVPFWAGDVNCDTRINLSDPVYLANYLFKSGPPPCADP